jgi:hypothetical protein
LVDLKTIDWKSLIPTLIPAILSSSFIITGIGTFFSDIYNKPNIQIDIPLPNFDTLNETTKISVKNNGMTAGTNITMVIVLPKHIKSYDIFSTENVILKNASSHTLDLFISKIVPGGGSIVSIQLITDTKFIDSLFEGYGVFLTYDQGSMYKSFTFYPLSIEEKFFGFWIAIFSNPILVITIGIVLVFFLYVYYKFLRYRKITKDLRRIERHAKETVLQAKDFTDHEMIERIEMEKKKLYQVLDHLNLKTKGNKEKFDTVKHTLDDIFSKYCYIHKVIVDDNKIVIFGQNFGTDEGLVLVNQRFGNTIQWSNTRIDIQNNPNDDNPGINIRVIKNDGIETSKEIKTSPPEPSPPEPSPSNIKPHTE